MSSPWELSQKRHLYDGVDPIQMGSEASRLQNGPLMCEDLEITRTERE